MAGLLRVKWRSAIVVLMLAVALVFAAPPPAPSGFSLPSVDIGSPLKVAAGVLTFAPRLLVRATSHVLASLGADADAQTPVLSPSPAPAPVEIVPMRDRDAKFLKNPDGSRQAVFRAFQHYRAGNGKWEDVDLAFRRDGTEHVVDRNAVVIRAGAGGVRATDRVTGKGAFFPTAAPPVVTGRKATFAGPHGLTWAYTATELGIKLGATVPTRLGQRTFMFPYQLLGGASALSLDAGNLVSDAFTIPRAFALGADDQTYQAGAWRLGPGNTVEFDWDDSAMPQSALPYEIDPTMIFTPASADDGHVKREDLLYPPGGTTAVFTAETRIGAHKSRVGANYIIRNALMRWNTSSLPDSMTIIQAKLRVQITSKTDQDNNRSLMAGWYTAFPIDAADYTSGNDTSASGSAGWDLTNLVVGTQDLTLAGYATNISKTGYTGMRLTINGGQPVLDNGVNIGAKEDPAVTHPTLVVTYSEAPTTPTITMPASGSTVDTITPVLKVTSTNGSNGYEDAESLDTYFELSNNSAFATGTGQYTTSSGWMVGTSSWAPPPLSWITDGGGPFYWRAKARDPFNPETAWSATATFSVRTPNLGTRESWPMWSHGPATVNLATGNLVLGAPGPSYPTATGSMGATLSYNAHDPGDRGFGAGWVLNAGDDAAAPPSTLIDHAASGASPRLDAAELVLPDGSSEYYMHVAGSTQLGAQVYRAPEGSGVQLKRNGDGSWVLTDEDGTIYTFGAADATTGLAKLETIEVASAAAGQGVLTYAYSGSPARISEIRDAAGRTLTFRWTAAGVCTDALLCIVGPDNVTWKYVGSGTGGTTGRLVKVIRTTAGGSRDVVEIGYNADGLPATIKNANDLSPSQASPGYNAAHAVTIGWCNATPECPATPYARNQVRTVSDGPVTGQTPATSTWTFTYLPGDVATSPTQAAHGALPAGTARTAAGKTTVLSPNHQATPSKVSTVFYDARGRTMQNLDVLGNITRVAYNERDQVQWSEDAEGNPTDYRYQDPTVAGEGPDYLLVETTGTDPDGTGPLGRPVTRSRYDETKVGTASAAGPALQGLQASYFENTDLKGRPKARTTDANVDFDWQYGGAPALPGRTEYFSVRWSGNLWVPSTGSYRFTTEADDGTRLTVDGHHLIEDWNTHAVKINTSPPVSLTAGWHKLVLEYYQWTGPSVVKLRWSCAACSPAIAETAIPASSLRPGWNNPTSSIDPAGNVSFHHFADPAAAKADYDLVNDGTNNLITSYEYEEGDASLGRLLRKVLPMGNASRTIDADGKLTGTADYRYATTWTYYGAHRDGRRAADLWPRQCIASRAAKEHPARRGRGRDHRLRRHRPSGRRDEWRR